MQTRDHDRELQVSPHLMLLTVKQLAKENAELFEEVRQLRAAVNVYRELAMRKDPAVPGEFVFGRDLRHRKTA